MMKINIDRLGIASIVTLSLASTISFALDIPEKIESEGFTDQN